MKRILLASLCIFVMAMVPAITLAKAKKDGHGEHGSPSPKSSAYEHADDNASFLRDTHDMGKHQGENEPEGKGEGKSKEKSKNTGKDDKTKGKEAPAGGKEKDQDSSPSSNDKSQNENKGRLEKSDKIKGEKVK